MTTQAGKAVDAQRILLLLIGFETARALLVGPFLELFALSLVLQQWHCVPTRSADPSDIDGNDGSNAGFWLHCHRLEQWSKLDVGWYNRTSIPVNTNNLGRTLEGTEHENDSAILTQMSDRFDTAAREIYVSYRARIENPKRTQPLRRAIDVSTGIERRRGNEEHGLSRDELS